MGKRQALRCGPSLACLRQQCHWRSEYPEFCLNVEESSSLYDSEKQKPITCNEAPLSTMYVLSLECIAKPDAVFFTFCGDVASEEVCVVDIAVVSFCLEELFVMLVSPCFVKISCSSFHSVDCWSYGGAFGDLPFLLPVWITFRYVNFSLNLPPSKL